MLFCSRSPTRRGFFPHGWPPLMARQLLQPYAPLVPFPFPSPSLCELSEEEEEETSSSPTQLTRNITAIPIPVRTVAAESGAGEINHITISAHNQEPRLSSPSSADPYLIRGPILGLPRTGAADPISSAINGEAAPYPSSSESAYTPAPRIRDPGGTHHYQPQLRLSLVCALPGSTPPPSPSGAEQRPWRPLLLLLAPLCKPSLRLSGARPRPDPLPAQHQPRPPLSNP